ncbi:MAG: hypothetical protein WCB46_10755 [Methanoregula sp.]
MVHYLSFLKGPTDDRATTNYYHCCPEHEVSMVDAAVSSGLFTFIIVPLLIFCARVCDMTLDTIWVIFLSKGVKYLPPRDWVFEMITWLVAIGQVMNTMTNVAVILRMVRGLRPAHSSVWRSKRRSRFDRPASASSPGKTRRN